MVDTCHEAQVETGFERHTLSGRSLTPGREFVGLFHGHQHAYHHLVVGPRDERVV